VVEDLKSRKDLLISAVVIILGIFGAFYIHSTLLSSIDNTQYQLRMEKEKNNLLLELKTVDKRAGKEKDVLFASSSSEMLQMVSSFLNRDYITVISLVPSTRKTEDIEKFFVKAKIEIAYRELLILLKDIESMNSLIVLDKVHITKGKGYSSSRKLEVTMDLYTVKKP